jgi:uncharacterized membrane protein YbhN (UPF0104 family)
MARLHPLTGMIWRYVAGLGIVAYLLVTLDFAQIFHALKKAEMMPLIAGILCVLTSRYLHSWQIWLVLRSYGVTMRLLRVFVLNLIVGFYSLFLPSASTGVMKWYRLSKSHGNASEVFVVLLFTRIVNIACICVAGCFALLATKIFHPSVSLFAVLLLTAIVILYLVLFVLPLAERMQRICEKKADGPQRAVFMKAADLLAAVTVLRTRGRSELLSVLAASVSIQLLLFCLFAAVASSIELSLPPAALVWIGSMVYLIQLIPVSVSGLGVREGALVLLMPFYGVTPVEALTFSLIIFGYTVFVGLLGGVLEVFENIRVGRVG